MQQDYDLVVAFEKQSIGNKLKIESWERFLSNWKDDNPYSGEDKELRSKAQTRITYWQKEIQEQKTKQQAVKQQKKPAEVALSGEYALKKLKATNSCEFCVLKNTNLEGANLVGANLEGANLVGANLVGANLIGTRLKDANLRSADLSWVNFKMANLEGANLNKANLTRANLTNAKFCKTTMPDGSINNDDCLMFSN